MSANEEWKARANGFITLWGDANVLEVDNDDDCTACEYTKSH